MVLRDACFNPTLGSRSTVGRQGRNEEMDGASERRG